MHKKKSITNFVTLFLITSNFMFMETQDLLLEAMSLLKLAHFRLEEANEIDATVSEVIDLDRLKELRYEVADYIATNFTLQ